MNRDLAVPVVLCLLLALARIKAGRVGRKKSGRRDLPKSQADRS